MDGAWQKYAEAEVPRYTSYPPATQFRDSVGEAEYRAWLGELRADDRLSLYVHIPFCSKLCWYCGCHTTIVHSYDRIADYLTNLDAEIKLLSEALGQRRPVIHIHFGGGTPTLLAAEDFAALTETLRTHFDVLDDAEIAVEADPRTITTEKTQALADAGVTRVSLGVQDFAPEIQARINRIQPYSMVARAVEALRAAGIAAINFDLMYGLPGQTDADVARSAELAASLRPDRLAVFGYAHVPWFKKHQRVIDTRQLPGTAARFTQASTAAETLKQRGYVEIGFDHYARPTDSLAKAVRDDRLRRNFQGYTDDGAETLLGLGASSIGSLAQGFVQNAPGLGHYRDLVSDGRLAAVRGIACTDEDRLRGAAIERIMCGHELDLAALCCAFGRAAESLDDALPALVRLEEDGLVEVRGRVIRVPESARRLVRNVAACFDAYWTVEANRHSAAV